jgi:uncharacterized membrane protein
MSGSNRVRRQLIKRYFITGLLIWVPLVITGWVLSLIVGLADQSLRLLPAAARPQNLLGVYIPGAGIVVAFVIILATGLLATNFIGQRLVGWWEQLLARIPVVNSIYTGVKQVSDTLLSSSGMAFRQPLLVPYPHPGSWTIAFLTGDPGVEVARHLEGKHVSVYVPTTPNPTSGFLLMFRKDQIIELDMNVDEAIKYIISMGVVAPPGHPPKSS